MGKSLLDYAYDFVSHSKGQVSFKDLWAYVVKEAGLDEEAAAKKVSSFYTNLMLDGRFVTLGENQWDLRTRHKYESVHIDMSEVYSEVEAHDEDSEEDEEEAEYNAVFEDDKKDKDDDMLSEDEEEESEEDDKEDTNF